MPKMQSTTDIADNAGAKMTKQRQTHLRMTSENDARNGVSMSIDSNKRGKKVKQKIEVLMKNVSYKRQENKPTIQGFEILVAPVISVFRCRHCTASHSFY